jgi:hypothetical protein
MCVTHAIKGQCDKPCMSNAESQLTETKRCSRTLTEVHQMPGALVIVTAA